MTRVNKLYALFFIGVLAICTLAGCEKTDEKPDFSSYQQVANLATLDCSYHNVAEIYNDGTDLLFGINIGYKKAWFEYDGSVKLGIDASKVKIEQPDSNNVVTITIPEAQVIGLPEADEKSFSDIYSDTGILTPITSVDQSEAYKKAQNEMKKTAENDSNLMNKAKERAKKLLTEYVNKIGDQRNETYEIRYKDAK